MLSRIFGKKDKKHRWQPLFCQTRDIIALMNECIRIGAPILALRFQYKGQLHMVGLSSDHAPKRGFFDVEFYLDEQIYYSMIDFLDKAEIDSCRLIDIREKIAVLEADDHSDPRNYTLLAACELPD